MLVPHPLAVPIVSWLIELVTGCILLAIIVRIVATWLNISQSNSIILFVIRITDPILGPIRRMIGMVWVLDLSSLVAIFLIFTIRTLLLQSMPFGW